MKEVVVDVRIRNADPRQGIDLKVPLPDVGEEGPPFIGTYPHLDSNLTQETLDRLADPAAQLILGRLVGQGEPTRRPRAIRINVPRLVQEALGLLRIVFVGFHFRLVGPVQRREHPRGRLRKPPEEVFDDRLSIDGMGDRLPHLERTEDGILEVEPKVGVIRSLPLLHRESGFPFEGTQDFGFDIVLKEVNRSLS